jgi:hypothetical protein
METTSLNEPTLSDLRKTRIHYLGKIHVLARKVFGIEVGRCNTEADNQYRDWLESECMQRSCVSLNNETLAELCDKLTHYQPRVAIKRGGLTQAQLNKISALCRDMGWDGGGYDVRFRTFCERTIPQKYWNVVFEPTMLRRRDASRIIVGLTRWRDSIKRRFECHAKT